MPLALKELVEDPRILDSLKMPLQRCHLCGEPFTEGDEQSEEIEELQGGRVHKECRQGKMSKGVEEDPIRRPRVHRG